MSETSRNDVDFANTSDPVEPNVPAEVDDGSDLESLDDYDLSFEERLPKIRALCSELWPGADQTKTVIGEPQAGGWNQVYPIIITKSRDTQHFVLRIPCVEHEVLQTVLILQFLHRRRGRLPIPKVIMYDLDHHNPINYPYIVLERLPGKDLSGIYSQMAHAQKVIVAKKLGTTYRQLLSITNSYAGLLKEPREETTTPPSAPWLMPFGMNRNWKKRPDPRVSEMGDNILTTETLEAEPRCLNSRDISLLAFKRRLFYSTILDFEWEVDIEKKAMDIINHVARDGLLDDRTICLWHTDLFPRNIMVDVETKPKDPVITGLLDWDDAALAPRFMACQPPYWLWDTKIDDDDTGTDDDDTSTDEEPLDTPQPQTAEAAEIKQAFDLSAGKVYCKLAYNPKLIVVRRLLRHCLQAQWSDSTLKKFEDVFDHWEILTTDGPTNQPNGFSKSITGNAQPASQQLRALDPEHLTTTGGGNSAEENVKIHVWLLTKIIPGLVRAAFSTIFVVAINGALA